MTMHWKIVKLVENCIDLRIDWKSVVTYLCTCYYCVAKLFLLAFVVKKNRTSIQYFTICGRCDNCKMSTSQLLAATADGTFREIDLNQKLLISKK